MPTKESIYVKIVKPHPNIRLGAQIFADSRDNEYDLWTNKSCVIRKSTGDKIFKSSFFEEITKLNLSFNKFVVINFHIKSSTIFRDFLYTFNNTAQWARNSRTTASWEEYYKHCTSISEEFWVDNDLSDSIKNSLKVFDNKYNELKGSSLGPNECLSQYTHLAHTTEYWWGVDLQSLFKILKFMEEEIPLFFSYYGLKMIKQLDQMMAEQVKSVGQFSKLYEICKDKIFYDDYVNMYINDDFNKSIFSINNVGLGLYSQLIRHSDIVVRGFIEMFKGKTNDEIRNMNLVSEFCIPKVTVDSYYGNRFDRVLRTRMCWFSKTDVQSHDSWMKLIEPYLDANVGSDTKKFMRMLPCKGNCNQCTIKMAMESRLAGADPELPCAVLCEAKYLAESRFNKVGNKLNKLYLDLFNDGLVKDNPKNESRIRFGV